MKYFLIVAASMLIMTGTALAQETGFGDWDAPFVEPVTVADSSDYTPANSSYYSNSCGMSYNAGGYVSSGWDDWYSL